MNKRDTNKIQKNLVYVNKNLDVDSTFLAYFFQEGVLTNNAVEEISVEKTTAARNSKFIMMLMRRGPKAFPTLMSALVNTSQEHIAQMLDEPRARELIAERDNETPSSPVQETQPPAEPSTTLPYTPTTNTPTTFNTQAKHNSEGPESAFMSIIVNPVNVEDPQIKKLLNDTKYVYPIRSEKRGRAVIINNEYFIINPETKKNLSDRQGSEYDLVNLDQLLQRLGFDTVVHDNLDREEILNVLKKEQTNQMHQSADAFIFCIFSHGAKGIAYGRDGSPVKIEDEICASFDGKNCPALVGKPKIFIIQACQGTESTVGVPIADDDGTDVNKITQAVKNLNVGDTQDAAPSFFKNNVHEKTDMLIAYSTVGGYKSWRRPDLGSWFIRAIVEVFRERANSEHIVDMLTKVRGKVKEMTTAYAAGNYFVQVTKTDSTLSKDFYFFPGYKPQTS